MLAVLEPDGRVSWANEVALDYLGIGLADLSADDLRAQIIHPDDFQKYTEDWQRGLARGMPFETEQRMRGKDGRYRWFLVRYNPVNDAEGRVVRWYSAATDIEDRRHAEEVVRRSEKELRDVVETIPALVWSALPDGSNAFVTRQWTEYSGLSAEQISGSGWQSMVHPDDLAGHTEKWRQSLATGEPFEHETRFRQALDGQYRWFLVRGMPLRDEHGNILKWYGTVTDIEDRKRAEEQLRESEGRFRTIFEDAGAGIALVDQQGRSIKCNPMFTKMLGFTEEELRRMVFTEFTHPDDIAVNWKLYRELVEGKRDRYDIEKRYIRKDGGVMWGQLIVSRVKDKDRAPGDYLVSMVEDITDRKRAEEEVRAAETRFRASVDYLTDALFIHDDQDDQGRVIDVNQQACDSLGYTREELIGMTAADFDALADATLMQSVKERLARGEIFSFKSLHRRKDGTTFPVEVRVRPFWHGDHRFGLALARDITDRKRTEQERERLRQLEIDLAHLNRVSMMGELAASLTHEIKQPIAAAALNAETCLLWLQREPPDIKEACETAKSIAEDINRAAEIIDRNRSLCRRDTPKWEIVNLNELVREMIALLRDKACQHSISISPDLDGALPVVTADRVQLQQVLMNLMLNGIEAMKDTTGELTIRSNKTEDGHILLSVSDTGIGLHSEDVERIFDAFFTTKAQGTGMGLSICRRIVESHGGRLWASANAGPGATFHFTLPAAPSTSDRQTGNYRVHLSD